MTRGGARPGAGRTARYGEKTKALRLPESLISKVLNYVQNQAYQLPLYSSKVAAGFPSPADDHVEGKLDLNEHLIKHPAATFFVQVSGDSMIEAGIYPGDTLVVDRSLTPTHGKIVIVALNGELTVKRLSTTQGKLQLLPENKNYKPIPVQDENDLVIWGVVTTVLHPV